MRPGEKESGAPAWHRLAQTNLKKGEKMALRKDRQTGWVGRAGGRSGHPQGWGRSTAAQAHFRTFPSEVPVGELHQGVEKTPRGSVRWLREDRSLNVHDKGEQTSQGCPDLHMFACTHTHDCPLTSTCSHTRTHVIMSEYSTGFYPLGLGNGKAKRRLRSAGLDLSRVAFSKPFFGPALGA